jgi:translocation and assembly module TamB
VDDVSVRRAATASDTSSGNGSLSGAVVSLGKRVSSKVYVGYEQGLAGAASAVKINYTLSKRWSVRLAAGSDNALDVFYKFTFD